MMDEFHNENIVYLDFEFVLILLRKDNEFPMRVVDVHRVKHQLVFFHCAESRRAAPIEPCIGGIKIFNIFIELEVAGRADAIKDLRIICLNVVQEPLNRARMQPAFSPRQCSCLLFAQHGWIHDCICRCRCPSHSSRINTVRNRKEFTQTHTKALPKHTLSAPNAHPKLSKVLGNFHYTDVHKAHPKLSKVLGNFVHIGVSKAVA